MSQSWTLTCQIAAKKPFKYDEKRLTNSYNIDIAQYLKTERQSDYEVRSVNRI